MPRAWHIDLHIKPKKHEGFLLAQPADQKLRAYPPEVPGASANSMSASAMSLFGAAAQSNLLTTTLVETVLPCGESPPGMVCFRCMLN